MARLVAPAVLALATAACWPVPRADSDNTNHNPFETAITAANVDQLEQKWAWEHPANTRISPPVVSSGGVHIVDDCQLVTLTPRTGVQRWTTTIDPFGESTCRGTKPSWATILAGLPHVSGDTVSAGVRLGFYSPPYNSEFTQTAAFDVATGAPAGSATEGVLAARRGAMDVSYTMPLAPSSFNVVRLQRLTADDGTTSRAVDIGVSSGGAQPELPLVAAGESELVVGGSGPRTATPGDTEMTNGLFGYSYDQDVDGCGESTLTVYPPSTGGPYTAVNTFDCPTWVNTLDGGYPTATPVLGADGLVYTTTTQGNVFAIDGPDTVWSAPIGTAPAAGSSPALANGVLYAPTGHGTVAAFAAGGCGAATCSPVWTADTGTEMHVVSTVVAGDVLYVASGGTVFAFPADGCGAATCEPLVALPTADATRLVVANGQVYATGFNQLTAFGLP